MDLSSAADQPERPASRGYLARSAEDPRWPVYRFNVAMAHASFWDLLETKQRIELLRFLSARGQRGQVLLRQGVRSRGVLLIREGWAIETLAARNGSEVILRLHGPGDIIGESALVFDIPCQTTVRALTPVNTTTILYSDFASLVETSKRASLALAQVLKECQEAADRRTLALHTMGVPERLAHLITELADRYDQVSNGVVIPFSQDELARWIGTTRTSVTRVLSRWRGLGMITTARGTLTITDFKELTSRYARDWTVGSPRTWT
jgi:CRP/FNR family cyclic AMP-dependent transcriptional regulator